MKNYIIAGILGLIVIGAIGYIAVGNNDDANTTSTAQVQQPAEEAEVGQVGSVQSTEPVVQPEDVPEDEQESEQVVQDQNVSEQTQTAQGSYQLYSQSAVANASGNKVLFFHASWCPQCKQLEADIKAKGVPAGTTIFEVDYDSNQDLRAKYGVTQQTTTVLIDDNGDLVRKYGAYSSPTLAAVVSGLGL